MPQDAAGQEEALKPGNIVMGSVLGAIGGSLVGVAASPLMPSDGAIVAGVVVGAGAGSALGMHLEGVDGGVALTSALGAAVVAGAAAFVLAEAGSGGWDALVVTAVLTEGVVAGLLGALLHGRRR